MTNYRFLAVSISALTLLTACNGWVDGGQQQSSSSSSSSSADAQAHDMIELESPASNDIVTSPLTITGQARGNWYFEASFPVELLDANGNRLAMHYAEAQGEWMTTEFVPFKSTITFLTPTTPTGTLILHKDNPSGLPENDDSIRIPVRFR